MKIELSRLNDHLHFEGKNEAGNAVNVDIDGAGMRPMQLLLTAVATCSAFDVVEILKKQRQGLEDVKITATGDREEGKVPRPFTAIHIHFTIIGEVEESKAARAVELGVEKYCSVGSSLDPNIKLTHSFEIVKA